MNALIRLWNVLSDLASELRETVSLVKESNARLKQSMGLPAPQLKLIDVSEPAGDDAEEAPPETNGRRKIKA